MTLACPASDAVIRYTLDGTMPGPASPVYTRPLALASSVDAVRSRVQGRLDPQRGDVRDVLDPDDSDGQRRSSRRRADASPPAAPSRSLGAGGRHDPLHDGRASIPPRADPVVASGAPIAIGRSLRLKARAWKAGLDPSAVAVADFSVVGAVAAGSGFTVVLKSDGTLAAWGYGGHVGDGTSGHRCLPVPVTGLDGAVAVSAGMWHTLVLRADGTVWAWGSNT